MLDGGHIGKIVGTHFHRTERGLDSCLRTTIEGHSLATYELFDAAEGGLDPCMKVVSEMLEGGALGPVEVTVDDPSLSLRVLVGANTYNLIGGVLVPEVR